MYNCVARPTRPHSHSHRHFHSHPNPHPHPFAHAPTHTHSYPNPHPAPHHPLRPRVRGRFSYRGWQGGQLACVQEVRDAVRRFRDSAGPASEDGAWGGDKRRFSIAVADSFGEGGPVRRPRLCKLFVIFFFFAGYLRSRPPYVPNLSDMTQSYPRLFKIGFDQINPI